MAFTPAQVRTPVSIGVMHIRLTDEPAIDRIVTGPDGEEDHIVQPASQSAQFSLRVVYSDNTEETIAGNLVPHITTEQITALQSFLTGLRAQAEEQILPEAAP